MSELCKQVARECGGGVTIDQVNKVITTMWRVMLEELFINPHKAQIMFTGIGKFDMKLRRLNVFPRRENGTFTGERELKPFWVLRFHPSNAVKEVMQNKKDLRDLELGFKPLYYDKETRKPPRSKMTEGRKKLREMHKNDLIRKHRQDYIDNMERIERIDLEERLPED